MEVDIAIKNFRTTEAVGKIKPHRIKNNLHKKPTMFRLSSLWHDLNRFYESGGTPTGNVVRNWKL